MNHATPAAHPSGALDYDPFAGNCLARVVATTEAQREVWLADQLGPEASLAYNESVSLTLDGALSLSALQQALQALAQRHDALRATLSGDGMHLFIAAEAALEAHIVDLCAHDAAARSSALAALRVAAVETPFELCKGPLFRATLVLLGVARAELILTGHHIVYDGWSCAVVTSELMQLYAAFTAGAPASLALAPSFADYALAERSVEHAAQAECDARYWRALHDATLPALDLPTDRARPARRSFASRREDLVLGAALTSAIRQFGAGQGASLFATLFALFGALVGRLAASDEVVLGVPAAGQARAGTPLLVGHCVNLLPIRLALDAEAPASSLIKHARSAILDAYEHQSSTLGGILKQLQVAREPGRLPLVQVLFNLDAAIGAEALSHGALRVALRSNPRMFDNFELFLNASQSDGALVLELQYNSALFERATVQRWLALYRTALERVLAEPAQSLASAFAANDADLAVLARWNDTAAAFEHNVRIETLIARQAAATPQASAVRAGHLRLSYAELERRANGVAVLLRARGVAAGDLVGLCCARNEHLLIALLGILKAGAGYVPLDPCFPPERLEYMASAAHLAFVLTGRGAAAPWPFGAAQRIDIDDAHAAETAPAHTAGADELAYVIFTSGSSGQPKGVQVAQRAVVNFLTSMRREPGIEAGERLLAVTTLSFDIAVLELLLPLCAGAEVILASTEQAQDAHLLAQLLRHSEASIMQATPGTWRMLLDAGWRGAPGFKALVGGETLTSELAARLVAATGATWNMYGPTETTVWSSCWRVTPVTPSAPVCIGRPIANTTFTLLDAQRRPCPLGVPGEIWIGGAGLCIGYLNHPELNVARFIDDPTHPGHRLYGTGDRGRWRLDGMLEHLGRLDAQLKVRGFRIEPGEIEAALARHPSVADSVVVAREDVPGDVRLIAYLVAPPLAQQHGHDGHDGHDGQAAPDSAMLRAHLRSTLPEYMLPQHFVTLARLPLLPNGKIDRKALPAPGPFDVGSQAARQVTCRPARTPLEQQVLDSMEQLLHLPRLGVDENFFAVGGHSLLASQLAVRIGSALQMQIPLRAIFDAPSAELLAQWIAAQRQAGASAASAQWRIARRVERASAPLSSMQERLWFLEQMNPGRPTYNTPSAHRLRGQLDEAAFNLAFADLIARQDVLRTKVAVIDARPVQVILPALEYSLLPLEDLRGSAGGVEQALSARLAELAATALNLGQAPLFRARLLRTGEAEYVFYFAPHHIIWDGWCFDILYTEMAALYEARRTGVACTLPELRIGYGDFAAWHQQWMKGEELAAQLRHWRTRLSGPPEPLAMATDLARPADLSGCGATSWIAIPRERVEAARALAGKADATLFMALLAAYVLSLHQLTGQTEFIIGVPVRGRAHAELETLMGMFVNALPLRLSIDPESSFMQLLCAVRESVIDAFQHPDVPFEQLVRELDVVRERNRFPLYQALFSFQDARARQQRWGNLEHEMIDLLQPGLEEDLALWLLDRPGDLVGGLSYSSDLLHPASATLMARRYEHLIAAVLAQPDAALWQLPLAAHEQHQLAAWNARSPSCPPPGMTPSTVSELIALQVRAAPHKTALRHAHTRLSYGELDQRAERLAQFLRARGVQCGQHVGLCLERGPEMVIAVLAVLKSGAAWVPLDPAYPAERLRFMAADASLATLISMTALTSKLDWPRAHSVLLDADADAIAASLPAQPGADPLSPRSTLAASADNVAYVIYTSGSSGQPKGVQVTQRALVNFLTSMRHEPGINASDRLLAVTTLSFDIAVLELLLPLCAGAEIILASTEQAQDALLLAQLLRHSEASIMQATPGTWRMLLDAGWRGAPGFKALVGGETLTSELAARLLAATGQTWNMYGPTETTVWSSCWRVTPVTPSSPVCIGRPIANTRFTILDAKRRPCPLGVPGEIWIGGAGLCLGYLNRPDLNRARFIDDPDVPGARLYGTGDRGRWRLDGMLEHLGRLDAQLKVRGFRIEPGEIEAALARHPSVADSVVVAREDVPGDVRLIAYLVAPPLTQQHAQQDGHAAAADSAPDKLPESTTLRAHLRSTLPEYMLPQHFVTLARLPLLPNGKIDRKALPAPALALTAPSTPERHNAPHTDTEKLLAALWADLLETPHISADDNFFDAGGHSLLAMQAILALQTRIGKSMNPRRFIFESLRQIARAYDEAPLDTVKPGVLNRLFSSLRGKSAL